MNNLNFRLAGRFRLIVKGESGEVKQDTGWFDNLITNQGLDMIGDMAVAIANPPASKVGTTYCAVGTGTATPAFTDTQLATQIASRVCPAQGTLTSTYVPGPPAYWSGLVSAQFSQGAVVANLTEVGMGVLPTVGSTIALFNRALILDGSGNPTTLPVVATDTLTVTYELRLYLDLTDHSYSITIGGTGYSGIYRMANVNSPTSWFNSTLDYTPFASPLITTYYTGSIGTVTSNPTGSLLNAGSQGSITRSAAYSIGTYTASFTANIGANVGSGGSITALLVGTNLGNWQFSISPAWVRASYQSIAISYSVSWARYP